MAEPMPLDAPVTTATLPVSLLMCSPYVLLILCWEPATVEGGNKGVNNALSGVTYCADPGGTFEKSGPSPSAIVGWTRTASRSLQYGKFASIAVCTAAKTSPASEPIIVKP